MSRARDTTPYTILLGDVGTGKSTIVEKLSGVTGKSSDSSTSFTKSSEVFEIFDGIFLYVKHQVPTHLKKGLNTTYTLLTL